MAPALIGSPLITLSSLVNPDTPEVPPAASPSPPRAEVSQSNDPENPDPKDPAADQNMEQLETVPADRSIAELSVTAQERVECIIHLLLLEGGICPSQVKMPTTRVSAEERSSSYAPRRNEIVIHRKDFDSASTYGEEIFHWLRTQIKPESERAIGGGVLPWKEQFAVEEFFGFVGRAVISKLCEKTSQVVLDADPDDAASAQTVARYQAMIDKNERLARSISPDRLKAIETFATHLQRLRALSLGEEPTCVTTFSSTLSFCLVALEDIRSDAKSPESADDPRADEAKHLSVCETVLTRAKQEFEKARWSAATSTDNESLEIVMQHWCRMVGRLHEALTEYLDVSLRRCQQLAINKDESEMHYLGYLMGLRFLEREGADSGKIFQILRQPSKQVYFEHIYEKEVSAREKPWWSKLTSLLSDYLRYRKEEYRLIAKRKEELDAARGGLSPYTAEGREAKRYADELVASLPAKYRGIRLS